MKIKLPFNPVKTRMNIIFIIVIALVLLVTSVVVFLLEYLLISADLITAEMLETSSWAVLLIWVAASIVTGIGLSFIAVKIILNPTYQLLDGLSRLSEGDYSVRLDYGKNETMRSLSDGFNKLASELQRTEILRSDFVNNFSHELKTPLVSINGLISLMQRGNLSQEKQLEYLNIISEEAQRLSAMTTNILNLSKVESQWILTDKAKFNLSEQVRTCILLLEKQWAQKKLNLNLDFDEYMICGSEDMLKQVWFNLLDNAIKFADYEGTLTVTIAEREEKLRICVSNTGETVSDEDKERIFQKFYRGEHHDRKEGNGIGLSIVQHIVLLHEGSVEVSSENGLTTFTVEIPKE